MSERAIEQTVEVTVGWDWTTVSRKQRSMDSLGTDGLLFDGDDIHCGPTPTSSVGRVDMVSIEGIE